jgi:hypothetical protein
MNGHTHADQGSKRSYDRTFDLEKFMFDFLGFPKGMLFLRGIMGWEKINIKKVIVIIISKYVW